MLQPKLAWQWTKVLDIAQFGAHHISQICIHSCWRKHWSYRTFTCLALASSVRVVLIMGPLCDQEIWLRDLNKIAIFLWSVFQCRVVSEWVSIFLECFCILGKHPVPASNSSSCFFLPACTSVQLISKGCLSEDMYQVPLIAHVSHLKGHIFYQY